MYTDACKLDEKHLELAAAFTHRINVAITNYRTAVL